MTATGPACGAEMFARRVGIMGADPVNADVRLAAPMADVADVQPYQPWASPVMVLAGLSADGRPWLWLACGACGWFLGFATQHDPQALADAARAHVDGCESAAGWAHPLPASDPGEATP
jgi:hypothetical protein